MHIQYVLLVEMENNKDLDEVDGEMIEFLDLVVC
jgi:hypothetical protein